MGKTYAILTGEYPPVVGGVSDYSRQVARGLAGEGSEVHVFTPGDAQSDGAIVVRRLPDHFGVVSLAMLEDAINRLPPPREILVQYVPHAFGMKAMNVPLCLWLLARSRKDRITVMFHEVSFPIRVGQPLLHNVLGAVNHGMAAMLARAASRALVTIPAWERKLRELGATCDIRIAPVPSNLPLQVDGAAAINARAKYIGDATVLIGSFGSFGPMVTPLLDELIPALVSQDSRRRVLLIGRGSCEYRDGAKLDRVVATGVLSPEETAAAIAACDLLIQPYPDGVSGRRSSTSGALALGAAAVTNAGELSEDFWRETEAIVLAPSPREISAAVDRLLDSTEQLQRIKCAAKMLYQERFALEHTLRLLQE